MHHFRGKSWPFTVILGANVSGSLRDYFGTIPGSLKAHLYILKSDKQNNNAAMTLNKIPNIKEKCLTTKTKYKIIGTTIIKVAQ